MSAVHDYPAAHSMDTIWFAVDSEGHVAQLDSGEGGAVPEEARQGDADSGEDFIRHAIAPGSFELVSAAHGNRSHEEHYTWWPRVDVVVFVDSHQLTENWLAGPYSQFTRPKQPSRSTTYPHFDSCLGSRSQGCSATGRCCSPSTGGPAGPIAAAI